MADPFKGQANPFGNSSLYDLNTTYVPPDLIVHECWARTPRGIPKKVAQAKGLRSSARGNSISFFLSFS